MTAEERYKRCKTIHELQSQHDHDILGADTWEYLSACDVAFSRRIRELLNERKENEECPV